MESRSIAKKLPSFPEKLARVHTDGPTSPLHILLTVGVDGCGRGRGWKATAVLGRGSVSLGLSGQKCLFFFIRLAVSEERG